MRHATKATPAEIETHQADRRALMEVHNGKGNDHPGKTNTFQPLQEPPGGVRKLSRTRIAGKAATGSSYVAGIFRGETH